MQTAFKENGQYTLVPVALTAGTAKQEIIILKFDEANQYLFKHKGKRKIFYLPPPENLKDYLVFEGHNLPFVIDPLQGWFGGNNKFNFLTDNPDELKHFILGKCLNLSPDKLGNILYRSTGKILHDELFPPEDQEEDN